VLLVGGVALCVHAALYAVGLNPIAGGAVATTGPNLHLWVFATVTVPVLLYFGFFFRRGHTVGMRALGLRVQGADGASLSAARAFLRAAVLLVPFEVNHIVAFYPQPVWLDDPPGFRMAYLAVYAVLALYLAVVLWSPRRQGPHDLVARSVVVKAN